MRVGPPRAGSKIAVLGCGQIGAGLAVLLRRHGYRSAVWIRSTEDIPTNESSVARLESRLHDVVGAPESASGELLLSADLEESVDGATVIIECISEDPSAKVELLRRVRPLAKKDTLFCTTTSGLSITALAAESGCEKELVGTHFWNPPELMPLVEVVRGDHSSAEVVDRACQLVESIGKIAIRVRRDVPGFIGNRLLHAMWREALHLVEMGVATPSEVDLVARKTFGLRSSALGPFENMDLVGLDLVEAIHKYLLADLAGDLQPQAILSQRVSAGDVGMRSGAGFYTWTEARKTEAIERRNSEILSHVALADSSIGNVEATPDLRP